MKYATNVDKDGVINYEDGVDLIMLTVSTDVVFVHTRISDNCITPLQST